jgi:hypothetical protein
MAVLLAFVASGTLWVRRGVLEDIERLGALAGVAPAEVAKAVRGNAKSPRSFRAVALAVSLVIGVVIIPLSSGVEFSSLAGWDLHHVWGVATNVAVFFLTIDGAWLAIQGWRTIERYTRVHLSIDLLDHQTLASIGRIGLRGAVLWLGGTTIASTLTWGMNRIAPLVVILAITLTLATVSFLLPPKIASGRLREAKRAELARVRAKIARARDAALTGAGGAAAEQAALLPGLLAYEARIEAVREWPYDTSTLVRFTLLAVIAAGSWLGGAIVERALGAVLD